MPDQSLTVGARCRNHPDLGGLFVADMPASTAPYRQKVPLCAACGPRVEAIGFDVQPLDTGDVTKGDGGLLSQGGDQ